MRKPTFIELDSVRISDCFTRHVLSRRASRCSGSPMARGGSYSTLKSLKSRGCSVRFVGRFGRTCWGFLSLYFLRAITQYKYSVVVLFLSM